MIQGEYKFILNTGEDHVVFHLMENEKYLIKVEGGRSPSIVVIPIHMQNLFQWQKLESLKLSSLFPDFYMKN